MAKDSKRTSKYSKKRKAAAAGRFRKTSPFHLEHYTDPNHRLAVAYQNSLKVEKRREYDDDYYDTAGWVSDYLELER